MQLLGRNVVTTLRAATEPRHWRALRRIVTDSAAPAATLKRYLSSSGAYPWSTSVRTPLGRVRMTAWGPDDLRTINEVFFRRDYGDAGGRVVVDVGANIGISALFFLTRGLDVSVRCFEPEPMNLPRLESNTLPFQDRCRIEPVALTVRGGPVSFWSSPSGRYGAVASEHERLEGTITVDSRAIAEVLEEVLDAEGRISLLKIDTEGTEGTLVAAIPPAQRARIERIAYENPQGRIVVLGPGDSLP